LLPLDCPFGSVGLSYSGMNLAVHTEKQVDENIHLRARETETEN